MLKLVLPIVLLAILTVYVTVVHNWNAIERRYRHQIFGMSDSDVGLFRYLMDVAMQGNAEALASIPFATCYVFVESAADADYFLSRLKLLGTDALSQVFLVVAPNDNFPQVLPASMAGAHIVETPENVSYQNLTEKTLAAMRHFAQGCKDESVYVHCDSDVLVNFANLIPFVKAMDPHCAEYSGRSRGGYSKTILDKHRPAVEDYLRTTNRTTTNKYMHGPMYAMNCVGVKDVLRSIDHLGPKFVFGLEDLTVGFHFSMVHDVPGDKSIKQEGLTTVGLASCARKSDWGKQFINLNDYQNCYTSDWIVMHESKKNRSERCDGFDK